MTSLDESDLIRKLNQYKWYHRIKVTNDLYTNSYVPSFQYIWDLILKGMSTVDFSGKRVLDVGCRDGLFSFESENRGAAEVIGIDNDLSKGAVEFLIPYFHSKVKMYEMNLYDLTPGRFGLFDVILFPGVLYHLRYPFWGLKQLVSCLSDNGILLVESGMLVEPGLDRHELLYCPVENSPYEETSCTFFNRKALLTTLGVFRCRLLQSMSSAESDPRGSAHRESGLKGVVRKYRNSLKSAFGVIGRDRKGKKLKVDRQLFVFQKVLLQGEGTWMDPYWNTTHTIHTRGPQSISAIRPPTEA